MGHSEAASGAVGLAKLVLMMQKGQVPPQASFQTLNPRLSTVADHNIHIPTLLQDWPRPHNFPRRALLNNFGAAGSNAALILEEYPTRSSRTSATMRSGHLLNVSARTVGALNELRSSYMKMLRKDNFQSPNVLLDLCYSANARRIHHSEFRISVVGSSSKELVEKLEHASGDERITKRSKQTNIFMFSGQANLYDGMGAELLSTAPAFKEAINRCDEILQQHGFETVSGYIANDAPVEKKKISNEEVISQCACFALQYALARVWQSWGFEPQCVIGHR